MLLHAIMMRAPLLAISLAVSSPKPDILKIENKIKNFILKQVLIMPMIRRHCCTLSQVIT